MSIKTLLKLEGLVVLLSSIYFYFKLGGNQWILLGLFFLPDLSMIGYKKGNQMGAHIYNLAHTYFITLSLIVIGQILNIIGLIIMGLIWTAHIGMDRTMGYGLKKVSGFKDTHINTMEE